MSIFITHGNRLIDFANPQNSNIHIDDIIHHLSMIPRFGGRLDVHYSVLDHSVYVATIAHSMMQDDMISFAALMHDAQEAYLGDVVSPLKALLPEYKKIEKAFESVIRVKFKINIEPVMRSVIKAADLLALKAEKEVFLNTLPEHYWCWNGINRVPVSDISPRDFIDSKQKFRDAFNYYNKALNLGLEESK